MSLKRPSSTEGEYIAREESKRKELERIRREQKEAEEAREARRGWGPCGCDAKLVEEGFRDILIDRCPACKGVWLDPGELEKITTDDAGVVRDFLNFFAGRSK
jgi:hypothetical protein